LYRTKDGINSKQVNIYWSYSVLGVSIHLGIVFKYYIFLTRLLCWRYLSIHRYVIADLYWH